MVASRSIDELAGKLGQRVGLPTTHEANAFVLQCLGCRNAVACRDRVVDGGHGLAMGRRPVVDDWLTRGRLIAPFGDADPTGAAYYLCRSTAVMPTAAGRRLERWLGAKAAEWRDKSGREVASP